MAVIPSYKKAVRAKCKDCAYDPLDSGKWVQQVEACGIQSCPLWSVRPKSTKSRIKMDLTTTDPDSPLAESSCTNLTR